MAEAAAAAFVFSVPQYMQTKDKKPAYYFTVTVKEPLVTSSEQKPDISDTLKSTSGEDFIKSFAGSFASNCSKFFPKPLVAEKLIPKLNHIVKTIDEEHQGDGVIMWHCLPISICVSGISLEVYWKVIKTTSVIEWEEPEPEPEPETQPEVQQTPTCQDKQEQDKQEQDKQDKQDTQEKEQEQEELKEVGSDDITTTGDDKPEFILGPSTAAKEKDKKKLREAKLQVELAKFRAARAYEKYLAKYGDDLSDTETEAEESDYE